MKSSTRLKVNILYRAGWYILGIFLFYAPFAFFQKTLAWLLKDYQKIDIHDFCLRVPLANVLTGEIDITATRTISLILVLLSAFLIGPFFCAKLCTAGALGEYLSRLLPDKWKIDWQKRVNPVPIRYGFLIGFMLTPLFAGSIACAFCNYTFLEKLLNGGLWGDIGVLGSTMILTVFFWLIVFGLFTKGGRGYCSFLCPVGAAQSFMHSIGARFKFTYKLRYNFDKCVSCSACVKACPMRGLEKKESGKGINYQIHNCITCRDCEAVCPVNAITFGRGDHGWTKDDPKKEHQPTLPPKHSLKNTIRS